MTPDLYQCQYEKAIKCAMDLPCLGCETHAKYAARSVVKCIKNSDSKEFEIVSEKTADGLGPLKIDLEKYEWRREIINHDLGCFEVGRALVKASVKFPFPVSDKHVYAICVNDIWYEESYRSDQHNFLWQELNL